MKKKRKLGRKLISFLLTLVMVVGLMPGMSLTAKAATYSDSISDNLQAGDILKPGARILAKKINVTLQANGWGDENEMSTSEKQFSVEMRGLEISEYENGSIRDDVNNYCYPYANGEKVSAWEVVSFDGGEEPWDPKTITLTGFAPPAREPVTEISSDTTLSKSINGYITITDNVTLDLAGYTITGGGYHSTIIINNECTLTLIDSSTGKTGKITGGGGDAGGGVAVSNNATFNMQGGTISGNTATNGGGVALGGGATFTMSGGTITGNSADNGGGVYSSGSSFSMTGGTISNNSAGDFNCGGGVLIQSGNFSMSGTAAIMGNDGGNRGGGVYFDGSTFTMSGGSISGGNHATSGGGVYVNSGTFNMTGGTITGNSTDGWAGGGVYTCSIFNMSGSAAITGNSAMTEGGGVYQDISSSAVFTMTGGSITNNSSGDKGYAGVCIRQNGTFNLSGGAVIDGNTHGSTEEDICLYPGSMVKVTGALTMENTMSVRLTDQNGNDNWTGIIAQGSGYTLTETDGAKFIASTTNRRAKYDSENSKEILVALYTVTYNANGATSGTVPTDENNPYESGSTVTVLGNTGELAKTGNTFNGWNTAEDGSGTPYAADATFNIERSTTLYAQWEEVTHAHDFTYYASGATITATCTADGCTLPVVEGKHTATLTIAASGGTYDGTTAYGATITDDNSIQGDAKVQYQKKSGESYGTATETAPTDAGNYKASITVGGVTASVEYTIAQADPTANTPTGLTATYGQTLADVSLEGKNPEGNTPGTWTWADSTQSVGDVVTPAATFKATFTPNSSNYKTVENVDVSVTVNKAANPATVTSTATVTKGGNTVDLASNVTLNGATGTVNYEISGEANGCILNGSTLTSGNNTGSVTVNVTVATDSNYEALAATPITVTVSDKGTQTITAEDVTVTYGDTGKSVSASVTDPTTGGGAISYAVKDGSGDYIDVDAASGALTIKKVPADGIAYVTVTAAETATYAQATKDVNVTVNTKAMTVSAENVNVTVDGQPHGITVNVTDPSSGATVKYGTEVGTYNLDASPTQTEVGETTVYYQVTADNYTTYTGSAKVTVSAKQTQTITASDVTATYGDTDKKVSATTNGNGTISYAVKDGFADYIDVDVTSGALTIKMVPADGKACVVVTAAETPTYAQATRDVTVTIKKANAAAATVTANNRTFDGTEKPLVTVTGTATGGEMQYALGTATEATGTYTTSIPTGTDAGTYYVWYMVKADEKHSDTKPACIIVTISKPAEAPALADEKKGEANFKPSAAVPDVKGVEQEAIKTQMEELAKADDTKLKAGQVKDVTVNMETKAVAESDVPKKEASAIKETAEGMIPAKDRESTKCDFLDIAVSKIVIVYDVKNGKKVKNESNSISTNLTNLAQVIDIPVKYDLTGKFNPLIVRYHNGKADAFRRLYAAPAKEALKDGTYYVEGTGKNAIVHIYTNRFSTYALLTSGTEEYPRLGDSVTVYRPYYGPTMEHFYTTSAYERRVLIDKYGWVDEGIAWKSPKAPTTDEEKKTIKPVYRLFNPFTTDHHYTKDANERKTLIDKYGWKDEGIAFYSNDKGDATVYRLWHPGLITGAHHFTTGKHEYDVLITRGWIGETEAFKVNAAS